MTRPLLLRPVERTKSWGAEHWLNATRPEGTASLHDHPHTLAELLRDDPSLLGAWARLLFGDELPIFTKLLRTDFPPLVHVGFAKAVDRATFLDWLDEEQAGLRELFAQLDLSTKEAFDHVAERYTAWATAQGLAAWTLDNEDVAGPTLAPLLRRLRVNRARIVDVLHLVDLRDEAGHLLLTSAGMVHAIFGLSHQFHAKDESRGALEALLGSSRADAAKGVSDDVLRARVGTELQALRATNIAQPKNEGWLPMCIGDELLLVEPQQSSDTTFSIADFYTPFVWDTRGRFRKGAPLSGQSRSELDAQLDGLDFSVTDLADVRHLPRKLESISRVGVTVSELIDDPQAWPFFTAHQLELAPGAAFVGAPARGTFQQLVVLDGDLDLADTTGTLGTIARDRPAFIPAGVQRYSLTAQRRALLLVLSVPGPYRAFPPA